MIKQTIKYTNFNGVEKEEDFYFNLSTSELTRLELSMATIKGEEVKGGFREFLMNMIEDGSGAVIMETFEKIIMMAYGVRTEDGESFVKSDEVTDKFRYSAAYDELFMKIVTDSALASEFVNGIMPKEISEKVDQDKPAGPYPTAPVVEKSDVSMKLEKAELTQDEINEILKKRAENA